MTGGQERGGVDGRTRTVRLGVCKRNYVCGTRTLTRKRTQTRQVFEEG